MPKMRLSRQENRSPISLPPRLIGMTMVLLSAVSWGLSGTASQYLFSTHVLSPSELVTIRMTSAGFILVIGGMLRKHSKTRLLLKNKHSWFPLLVFSIIGLLGVQYTYFLAINDGNAASATLLQYLGPPLMVLYIALIHRKRPPMRHITAIALAVLGTLLLATGGHLSHLAIPLSGVLWGLLSAICLVFYTIYPARLLAMFDAFSVVGWGMLVGGLVSFLTFRPEPSHWTIPDVLLVLFVVLFGTLMAFSLYLASLRYLSVSETGLLASAEPLVAVAATILFLHVQFDSVEVVGAALIMLAVIQLARRTPHQEPAVPLPIPSNGPLPPG